MTFTFGSICSGIEAASVAWHSLGWNAAWLAEVDVAASGVLAHRLGATAPVHPLSGTEKSLQRMAWSDRITNWGDMTVLPALVRSGEAAAPDLLCGGTPCQGFSVAGLRGGLEDPRGQLTLSFVELANAIDDTRAQRGEQPCIIFWENVPGVRTDEGNAFGHFLAGLVGVENPVEPGPRPEQGRSTTHWRWKKETGQHIPRWPSAGAVAGPRRTVAWRSSDAQYFGLAQRRERVFVVGSAREGFDPQAVLFEFEGVRRDSAPSRSAGENVTHDLAPCLTGSGGGGDKPHVLCFSCKDYGADASLELAPTMRAMNHSGSHANAGGQLAVVVHGTQDPCTSPDVAFALGRNGGAENVVCVTGDVTHTLRAEGFDASEDGTGRGQPIVPVAFVQNTRDEVRLMGGDGSIVGALAADTGMKQQCYIAEPVFPILEAGARTGVSTSDIRAGIGIGSGSDPMFTLQAGKQHGIGIDMAVRRLMPVECERLQGFPDSWTDVPVGKKTAADGPRYKQLGNSWAVPCVRWIGNRIAAHIAELDAAPSRLELFYTDLLASAA